MPTRKALIYCLMLREAASNNKLKILVFNDTVYISMIMVFIYVLRAR